MRLHILGLALGAVSVAACSNSSTAPTQTGSTMSFFVTSARSTTGNIGGLAGADGICQNLANAAGVGAKTWRAYLSVERDAANGNQPTNARSRIGNGPWFNAKGALVANNLTELHARKGDATVFIGEKGQRINGHARVAVTVEHDIMTGSTSEGTLIGLTCGDWTSDSATALGQVGHSDGLGPNGDTSGSLSSWNSAHSTRTAQYGAAARLYCFARNQALTVCQSIF